MVSAGGCEWEHGATRGGCQAASRPETSGALSAAPNSKNGATFRKFECRRSERFDAPIVGDRRLDRACGLRAACARRPSSVARRSMALTGPTGGASCTKTTDEKLGRASASPPQRTPQTLREVSTLLLRTCPDRRLSVWSQHPASPLPALPRGRLKGH
ncbi:hypothetical protein Q1695_012245 [Nippostrongylus brasiliensis]|nr:hypothetical protein Q1695_012245 [Nippostrongylus brasiliensis]